MRKKQILARAIEIRFPRVSRNAQNICAVTKVGTILKANLPVPIYWSNLVVSIMWVIFNS